MQKLYSYTDETGQDTEGAFFLVAVVIVEGKIHEQLREKLLEIENRVGKRRARWAKNRFEVRIAYLERILTLKELKKSVFYSTYHDTKEYISLTAHTLIQAIQHQSGDMSRYRVIVEIDGFDEVELARVRQIFKTEGIRYHKLRGPRDESVAFIRLADALAGFLRDAHEGQPYTRPLLSRFKEQGVIEELP